MGSIVKVKNKNGTTYIYSNNTIWDKETKKYKYDRKVIGKVTPDGETIMYEDEKPLLVKSSICYGNTYFLNELGYKIGLNNIIKKNFPDTYNEIIALSHYMICQDSSLSNSPKWFELNYSNLSNILSSQRISDLLKQIDEEKILSFFKDWVKYRLEKEYIAYDITSISSYSELIELVELGYNRDKEKLPQINMGMFFGEESKIPVFYNIYQGSIKDVKTIPNMLKYCDILKINKIKFVMDKGFYSDSNITELYKSKKHFTIAVPFKSALACNIVKEVKNTIHKPSKIIINSGRELVYGLTIEDKWTYWDNNEEKSFKLYKHIMYDDDKRNEIETRIIDKVSKLKEELEKYISIHHKAPDDITKYTKYFNIKKTRSNIKIEIKDENIEEELQYEGYLVIFSNDIKDVKEVFKTYRRKDVVEKAFDNLKNDLDVKRLKVHKLSTLKGKMFIAFISLILKTVIFNIIEDNNLKHDSSTNELIRELQKISLIDFNNKKVLTEISSTQKKIFTTFKIKEPCI